MAFNLEENVLRVNIYAQMQQNEADTTKPSSDQDSPVGKRWKCSANFVGILHVYVDTNAHYSKWRRTRRSSSSSGSSNSRTTWVVKPKDLTPCKAVVSRDRLLVGSWYRRSFLCLGIVFFFSVDLPILVSLFILIDSVLSILCSLI